MYGWERQLCGRAGHLSNVARLCSSVAEDGLGRVYVELVIFCDYLNSGDSRFPTILDLQTLQKKANAQQTKVCPHPYFLSSSSVAPTESA
jgi:hypothetical protein